MPNPLAVLSLCIAVLGGCASIPEAGTSANPLPLAPPDPNEIGWPDAYQPEKATFAITNTITIAAPPQVVWDQLIRAETWPQWYSGARDVKVATSSRGLLDRDAVFTWSTMDQNLTTKVVEFTPPFRLGWESRQATLKAYHAWLLIPTANGTEVVTDESQFGLLAHLQRIFLPSKLRNLHDVWLAELKARSEAAQRSRPAGTSGENEVTK